MNQKDMIFKDLKAGKFISPLDALNDYQCFRLGGRIHELRKEGHDIRKFTDKKKRYATYFLIAEGTRRCF